MTNWRNLWITVNYSDYFDFNDVVVNLLAAALGVMLYYGFRSPPPPRSTSTRRIWAAYVLALTLCAALALGSGRVQLAPSGQIPPGGIVFLDPTMPTLYLQGQHGLYDRWYPSAWREQHWVFGLQWGLASVLLLWLSWLGFGCRQR